MVREDTEHETRTTPIDTSLSTIYRYSTMKASFLLAWFCDLEALARQLDDLRLLVEFLGPVALVPESRRFHTSGFALPDEFAPPPPLCDWRSAPGLEEHRRRLGLSADAFPCTPGILPHTDDSRLTQVLEAANQLGLDVWGHAGVWSYGGEVFSELAARDFEGNLPDEGDRDFGIMVCPSRDDLNDWLARVIAGASDRYGLSTWFLDHARFPAPAALTSLFACACPHCAEAATSLGFDWEAMVATTNEVRHRATAGETEALLAIADASERIGPLAEWFAFRCRLLEERMAALRRRVCELAGREVKIGADVFPPSAGLLAGHDLERWPECVDFVTGGHGPNVAWPSASRLSVEHWSQRCKDPQATQQALRLRLGIDPTEDTVTRLLAEVVTAAHRCDNVPFYAPVPTALSEDSLERVFTTLADNAVPGAIISGLDLQNPEQLATLGHELRRIGPSGPKGSLASKRSKAERS